MEELVIILAFFSFWLGACLSSFLNVVIYRVPRGESVSFPPSHCPQCSARIKWWNNIPILSYLFLRGRCADCRKRISPRYFVVELIGAVLFLASFMHITGSLPADALLSGETLFGVVLTLLLYWIWILLMITGTFIDFDHKLLPDFVTVGGMILGLLYWTAACFRPEFFKYSFPVDFFLAPLCFSLSGLVVGFSSLWLVRFLGSLVFRREAMGMGDVFLMGAIGAIFGPLSVLFTVVFSSFFGAVFGLAGIVISKRRAGSFAEIPYGPYISAACLLWMFRGEEICRWYISLLGIRG